jgi:hypothetical protein
MKKCLTFFAFYFFFNAFAQAQSLTAGDLMCVGFNADGNDDLSFVALATIPANTTVYLRDDEWNGTAFNTGESHTVWNTGGAAIPLGSIINFQNVNSTAPMVNFGTATTTGNAGLAAGGDAVYMFLGTNENTPTRFLTAVMSNMPLILNTSLQNTGLTEGLTALVLLPADLDIAAYKGTRTAANKATVLTLLNDVATNWDTQDGSGDQHNDGITPDVPFSTALFTIGGSDLLPPSVTTLLIDNQTSIVLTFSEFITRASATNLNHYSFTPALTISNLLFDSLAKTVTLTVPALEIGKKYRFSGNGFVDLANNTQSSPSVFDNLYFNNYTAGNLVISEIMYNVGSNADSLEFVEVYNRGTTAIPLGGLKLTTGINGTFPEYSLLAQQAISIAADTAAFRRFYGVTAVGRWASDFLSNGGEKLEIKNTLNAVVDSLTYDDVSPWPLEADGLGASLEIINPASDNAVATNWRASVTATGKQYGTVNIFASPNRLPTAPSTPSVQFALRSISVAENATTIAINATITNPNGQPTKIQIVPSNGTALIIDDLRNAGINEITFTGDTAVAARTVTFNVLRPQNDAVEEADEYFILTLRNATNATIGRDSQAIVFLQDDDRKAPVKTNELTLKLLNAYKNTPTTGSNSTEIVAFEKNSKRLFVANSLANRLDIVDFTNPSVPTPIRSIDVRSIGGINSVVIQNGVIVACFEDSLATANGRVAFFDTAGAVLKIVTVGVLPDMVGISPDGKTVATANEGQPIANYTADPEGSVSLIDISKGIAATTQTDVKTISFRELNGSKTALRNAGVRIFGGGLAVDTVTVAQDLEPEYLAFSPDSRYAYVTLQENNAVIVIDLRDKGIAYYGTDPRITALGMKDMSLVGNSFDGSDQAASINLTNWRVKAAYAPDAIAHFTIDSNKYLITANEGDFREYGAINEEITVANLRLDAAKFPDSTILKRNDAIGRLVVSRFTGDTDRDGDHDELHLLGSRSFSIWDASTGNLVWDSGDWLERITRDSTYFNANNSSATIARKNRSDNKGPEPEGVATAVINGKTYAFISLERTGGVAVFNVTTPENPSFTTYANNRRGVATDDLGPEGILYINANDSPNSKNLLILANEVSSTLSIFELVVNTTPTAEVIEKQRFTLYPNPSVSDRIFFSRTLSGKLVNTTGQLVQAFKGVNELSVSDLPNGLYLVIADGFEVQKLVVKR